MKENKFLKINLNVKESLLLGNFKTIFIFIWLFMEHEGYSNYNILVYLLWGLGYSGLLSVNVSFITHLRKFNYEFLQLSTKLSNYLHKTSLSVFPPSVSRICYANRCENIIRANKIPNHKNK